MKKKLTAFEIALSAVSCALATIFMSLGINVDVLLATGYVVGCFALMLPLSRDFIAGDVLAYVASVLLTLLFGGLYYPWRLLPFILFFGIHPLINYLELRFRWNKILLTVLKAAWFDAMLYIAWRFVMGMVSGFDWIDQYIIPVILIGGTLVFLVYDTLIFRCQRVVNALVYRIDKH